MLTVTFLLFFWEKVDDRNIQRQRMAKKISTSNVSGSKIRLMDFSCNNFFYFGLTRDKAIVEKIKQWKFNVILIFFTDYQILMLLFLTYLKNFFLTFNNTINTYQ